jgi:hypothetical protein
VPRGDAFRLLQTHAGITAAVVGDIRRQRGEYKQAIEALSQGDLQAGFERLDRMGAIREVPDDLRHRQLADDYLAATREGKSALVVAPTHKEGREVTARIRDGLKAAGTLKGHERVFGQFVSYGLTEAQRQDPLNYQPGDVVRFHQNVRGGFQKGEGASVVGRDDRGNILVLREKQIMPTTLPLASAEHFDLYERRELPLAAGDQVRITKNAALPDGKRLLNGSIHTVASFNRLGHIVLDGGQVIPKEFGHLAHGYVATSHASQGKTVDRVLVAVGDESFAAASKEQFYVSASRGRESVAVYCENKRDLFEAVNRSGARLSATELAAEPATIQKPPPSRLVRLREHIHRHLRAENVRRLLKKRDRPAPPVKVAVRNQTQELER